MGSGAELDRADVAEGHAGPGAVELPAEAALIRGRIMVTGEHEPLPRFGADHEV
jgi:hypothetical protein